MVRFALTSMETTSALSPPTTRKHRAREKRIIFSAGLVSFRVVLAFDGPAKNSGHAANGSCWREADLAMCEH